MRVPALLWAGLALWLGRQPPCAAGSLPMDVDPSGRYAWSEDAGWLNLRPSGGGVVVNYDGGSSFLSGHAWAENVGWIKMGAVGSGPYGNTSATNWGVNMDAAWRLSGYAWSENLGWLHVTNAAPGAYAVRCQVPLATNQVPQWWLWDYGWRSNFDAVADGDQDGDRMLTWEEFHAGTIPTNGASFLGVSAIRPDASSGVYVAWQSVTGRTYSVERAADLFAAPAFATVRTAVAGQPLTTSITDTNAPGGHFFYRIRVQ